MEFVCCFNCENRTPGCHEECQEYKGWKEKHDKRVAELRRARQIERETDGYLIDRGERVRKRAE